MISTGMPRQGRLPAGAHTVCRLPGMHGRAASAIWQQCKQHPYFQTLSSPGGCPPGCGGVPGWRHDAPGCRATVGTAAATLRCPAPPSAQACTPSIGMYVQHVLLCHKRICRQTTCVPSGMMFLSLIGACSEVVPGCGPRTPGSAGARFPPGWAAPPAWAATTAHPAAGTAPIFVRLASTYSDSKHILKSRVVGSTVVRHPAPQKHHQETRPNK